MTPGVARTSSPYCLNLPTLPCWLVLAICGFPARGLLPHLLLPGCDILSPARSGVAGRSDQYKRTEHQPNPSAQHLLALAAFTCHMEGLLSLQKQPDKRGLYSTGCLGSKHEGVFKRGTKVTIQRCLFWFIFGNSCIFLISCTSKEFNNIILQ